MKEVKVILADCPGLGRIHLCECNSIHFNLGPVTVNLTPEAFAQAAILIQDAMGQLSKILAAKNLGRDAFDSLTSQNSQFTH